MPNMQHLALERGLNVLIEKPMATSLADARSLVALTKAKGGEIIMPYGWNYRPMTDAAHRLVKDGWVGEVRHIVAQMASALADLFGGEPMVETKDHLFRPPVSTWADRSVRAAMAGVSSRMDLARCFAWSIWSRRECSPDRAFTSRRRFLLTRRWWSSLTARR
jgi:hypothetical protein